MPPRQPYQQQPPSPQTPHYGYGALPGHSPGANPFHQHPSGHYEVLPTLQPNQNDGHSGHNPYDFIVNPNQSQQKVGLTAGLAGGSFFMKIGLLVGAVVVILIVAGLLISSLTPKGSIPGLISIAERQQEIIRVSTAATQQATTQDGKNYVSNVEASISSDQQLVITYLKARGTKLGSKQLALDQSAQTDSLLANAATANNYDNAVAQYLVSQLQTYEGLLRTTYSQTGSKSAKALLSSQFNNASLLIQQGQDLEKEFSS